MAVWPTHPKKRLKIKDPNKEIQLWSNRSPKIGIDGRAFGYGGACLPNEASLWVTLTSCSPRAGAWIPAVYVREALE